MLVSVSFICICACVGLLYRSSICVCVRYLYRCVLRAENGAVNTGMVPHNTDHFYVRVIG